MRYGPPMADVCSRLSHGLSHPPRRRPPWLTTVGGVAAAFVALAGLSGCPRGCGDDAIVRQQQRAGRRGAKERVVIGISQEPDTLLMPFKEMNASEHIGRPGALMLTVFDEHWQLQPQSAVAIPTVQNGGVVLDVDGGMTVTWTLREGLFWADGVPVTADDFVFGHEFTRHPELEVVDRAAAMRVTSMTAPDARTLVVRYAAPYAYYAYYRNHEPLPRHLLGDTLATSPSTMKQHAYGVQPVLGGAFTVSSWVPQSHIVEKRNPAAVAMRPKLDEIVWKIIPQTQTMEAALLSGSIDIISVIGFTFDQARDFDARHVGTNHQPRFVVHYTPALMIEHIDLNLDNPLLQDRRVRQALTYALDREGLVQSLFGGKQPVAHSAEPDDNDDPGLMRYPFDPAKARALLDDAGYRVPEGSVDGVRTRGGIAAGTADGARLSFTIHSTAGDRLREQVEQLIQSAWRDVGVELRIQNQPAKLLFGDTIRRRRFTDMVMFTWTKEPNKIDETYWRCDQKPTEANHFQGRNYPGFCDPRVDALLEQAVGIVDEAQRRAVHRQITHILAEELPMIPLYDRVDVSVTPSDFVGWRPTGVLQSVAWNAQDWHFGPAVE